jgi:isoleucyl-tRNA synthetase
MYIEGADQYRGWFQSSLLTAVGALDRGAPFKECLTHGWTVDGEGKAMHKSLGNGMDPRRDHQQIRRGHPAPLGRLRRLPRGRALLGRDLQAALAELPEVPQHRALLPRQPRGFDPDEPVAAEDMPSSTAGPSRSSTSSSSSAWKAYENYEFHAVSHAINDFCVVTLSSFYLDIIKDRLYCDGRDSLEPAAAPRPRSGSFSTP